MNIFKNQSGFATLEIILVIAIIAVFATMTVPQMARLIDKTNLDYEYKNLISTLNFTRTVGKSSDYTTSLFDGKVNRDGEVELWIHDYRDGTNNNKYELRRFSLTDDKFYEHHLTDGITLYTGGASSRALLKISTDNRSHLIMRDSADKNLSGFNITVTDKNLSGFNITVTSKFGYTRKIYADSVGRWHGE